MNTEEQKQLSKQIASLDKLSDQELNKEIEELRKTAFMGLIPHLIERWFRTENEELRSSLFQFFIDTKKQEALPFFMDALENEAYEERRHELISILWQSSMNASEYLENLIDIALKGDYMTIIEVGTVIDSFDEGFEDQIILDSTYQIGEAIDEESDEDRLKLLENLRQIVNELYSI